MTGGTLGEKGIAAVGLDASGVASSATDSLIERTTVTATTTVVGAGQDVIDAIRDKAIGAAADGVVDAARDAVKKDPPETTPPSA